MLGEKYSPSLRSLAHAGECATALHVIVFFAEMFFFSTCFGTDLFMVVERSKDITHVKLLQSLVAKISNVCERKREQVIVYMRDQRPVSFAYLREMIPFLLNIL